MYAANEANEWLIKRNCSASPRQLALVFASIVAVSLIFGLGFAAFGLWMALPFVGLELMAVGAAFVCYGRHATDFEHIAVSPRKVSIEQVNGARRVQWEFDPRASRVEVDSRGRLWGERVHVYLLAPGIKLELGRHLLDARRPHFARELGGTLMHARAAHQ